MLSASLDPNRTTDANLDGVDCTSSAKDVSAGTSD